MAASRPIVDPKGVPMVESKNTVRTEVEPLYYVAIGASAGGLEAIEDFFTHMPENSGLGFIVIQHLSPDYKSLMVELLSKRTSMPVHRAENGQRVLANHVYLIPPKKNLTIFHGKLILSDQDHTKGINLPIDVFLRSLAEDQGEKAIAIILSGTGSDGMRGVRHIKEYGGMVMVQDEESARFNGMPRAAISTGLPDFILKPAEMPKQLLSFIKSPYNVTASRSETLLSDEDGITRIFSLLREKCKVDFTYYKPSTITRRIERRMTVTQSETIKDYVNFLNAHPAEINSLFRELLIGVTSFFRDPEAFHRLAEHELRELVQSVHKRDLRLWVAGCSTGEEAYSFAILIKELMEELEVKCDVKIFATDIDREAVHFAAAGIYPESIAADVSPLYLSKYFFRKDEYFQVSRSIREMVVFAQHNLIKDPPFTNIDLISCRNLLIYLQPNLQKKILEYFNFSLKQNGILFLGTSETTGDMSNYFELLDAKYKIYRSKGKIRIPLETTNPEGIRETLLPNLNDKYIPLRKYARQSGDERVLERFLESIAQNYLPLTIIVNQEFEPLHILGNTEGYFKVPSGKPTFDITRMAVKELSIPLSTGIQKAFRQGQEVSYCNIFIPSVGKVVDLYIHPIQGKKGQEPLAAVMIQENKRDEKPDQKSEKPCAYDLSMEAEQRMKDLEQELQFTRENLQATIEELETANEELQATNEELLASNEELQSTNEELQSTNEELLTVNSEYNARIIELTELHNDIFNLLNLTRKGLLLLDENLEIRRFSPQISNIFNILDSDVGRSITNITHSLVGIDPIEAIREVQRTCAEYVKEVQTQDGKWYLMRIIPYSVGPNTFSGVALSFSDITEVKEAESQLRESEQRFHYVADLSPTLIWMSGVDKACFWFNATWLRFTGRTMEQEIGSGWLEGVHPEDKEGCLNAYSAAFDKREPFILRYRLRRADGVYRMVEDYGYPRYDENGNFLGYVGSCIDITERIELEERCKRLEAKVSNVGPEVLFPSAPAGPKKNLNKKVGDIHDERG